MFGVIVTLHYRCLFRDYIAIVYKNEKAYCKIDSNKFNAVRGAMVKSIL